MEVRKLKHSIYCKNENGRILAEITFPEVEENAYDITRTYVAEDLQGSGLAGKLVEQALSEIHERGGRVVQTSCPYAAHWMKKNGVKE